MFVRTKVLKDYPVFATPTIKLWSNQFKGYTGQNEDGFFATVLGVTACEAIPGVGLENVIYESKFFAEIPGDQVSYFAELEEGETEITKQITVVSGALVLPEKYRGMAFDNTIIGEDGKLYYQYVNGELPKSVIPLVSSPFLPSIDTDIPKRFRDEPFNLRTTGMTAGDSYEKNVVLFPVFYSDELNKSIKDSNISTLFSFDAPVQVQQGAWKPDDRTTRCSPCEIRWPPGAPSSMQTSLCYDGPLDTCGGIPYAYFQTLPETVNVLALNLAVCETTDKKPVVSVTDTSLVNRFQYQKVLPTGYKNNCFDGSFPFPDECFDENTLTFKVCNAFASRDEWEICNPLAGLNRGYSSQFGSCSKHPLRPCIPPPGPCEDVNCEAQCPPKTYIILYRYDDTITSCSAIPEIECSEYYLRETGSISATFIDAYDTDSPYDMGIYQAEKARCGTDNFPTQTIGNCTFSSKRLCKEVTVAVPGCSCTTTKASVLIEIFGESLWCGVRDSYDDSFPREFEFSSVCGRGSIDCSCCCFVDGNCDPVPRCEPDLSNSNIVIIKYEDTTNYTPNPFLIYYNNPAYMVEINDKIVFNFAFYIDNYFKTLVNYAQPPFSPAEVLGYKTLFRNPNCFEYLKQTFAPSPSPEYFFSNVEEEKKGITLIYDPETCNYRWEKFPNPITACEQLFKLPKRTINTSTACRSNIKHEKLEDYSFELACQEQRPAPPELPDNPDSYKIEQWTALSKEWPMKRIDYYGICKGEGTTLSIQMPVGLTLNDCTNILSWEFLKNAPKGTFSQSDPLIP